MKFIRSLMHLLLFRHPTDQRHMVDSCRVFRRTNAHTPKAVGGSMAALGSTFTVRVAVSDKPALSTLLRTKVKTPEAAKAAKDISLRRKPVYQGDLDDIEMYFMAAIKEIKKGIGSHYAEQEAMSKKVAEKMFTELTKGQDVQHPTITAEQLTDAMLDSVSGMEGATPEALEQLRNGLLGILQSAAEQENAHEADE